MITLENLKKEIEAIETRVSTTPDLTHFEFALKNVSLHMQDVTLLELLNEVLATSTLPDFETGKIPCYEEEIKNFVEYHLNRLPNLINSLDYNSNGQELINLKASNELIKILMGKNCSSRKFKIKE